MYRAIAAAAVIVGALAGNQASAWTLSVSATFTNNGDSSGQASVQNEITNIPVSKNGGVWSHAVSYTGSGTAQREFYLYIDLPGGRCSMTVVAGMTSFTTPFPLNLPKCEAKNQSSGGGASCSFAVSLSDGPTCVASVVVR